MKKTIMLMSFVPVMPAVIVDSKDGEKIKFATHGMYSQLRYELPLIYNHMY